jgi:choline kinase
MKKDIIILAAGVGSRLRPLTDSVPKCLVKVNGEAIIERILKQINAVNSIEKNIFIVTGYKADVLTAFVDQIGVKVSYVYNADYATTNNMYSLNMALKHTDPEADLVTINADCFYDAQVVTDILNAKGSFISIDKGIFNSESMKVKTNAAGEIIAMSKALTKDENTFVSMDIYAFEKSLKHELIKITNDVIESGDLNSWTEVAIDLLVKQGKIISGYDFTNRNWMEIDDHADLQKAQEIFRIQQPQD